MLMLKSRSIFPAFLILAALIMGLPTLLNLINGPAETPGIFDNKYTLSQASEISADSGKPMLVLVTADWCAPCQKLKRTTMVDPTVVDWVKNNTVPVFLEDGTNPQEIASLHIGAYPTTLLIQNGQVLASVQGAAGAKPYLRALSSALSPATAAGLAP